MDDMGIEPYKEHKEMVNHLPARSDISIILVSCKKCFRLIYKKYSYFPLKHYIKYTEISEYQGVNVYVYLLLCDFEMNIQALSEY